jgi:hypothetical protein
MILALSLIMSCSSSFLKNEHVRVDADKKKADETVRPSLAQFRAETGKAH